MDCKKCKEEYLKTIKRQRAIILHYSKEENFYRNLSTVLILLFILTLVIMYFIIK